MEEKRMEENETSNEGKKRAKEYEENETSNVRNINTRQKKRRNRRISYMFGYAQQFSNRL